MSRPLSLVLTLGVALLGSACASGKASSTASACADPRASAAAFPGDGANAASVTSSELRARVEALNATLMDRYRAGDMQGIAAMYSDDAVILGPNGYRVAGRAAIDAYWTDITQPVDWTLEIVAVDGGHGVIQQRGVSQLSFRSETGELHSSTVQFVVLWLLQPDGNYRIGVDAYW